MLWTYLSRWGNLSLLFEQADTALTPRQFLGVSGILALVGMFVPVMAGLHPSIVLPMGIMLAFLPLTWLLMRRRRRFCRIRKTTSRCVGACGTGTASRA